MKLDPLAIGTLLHGKQSDIWYFRDIRRKIVCTMNQGVFNLLQGFEFLILIAEI